MICNRLGCSDLQVSRMCLGSMTWGRQNSQDEAFAQMDYALDQGINFSTPRTFLTANIIGATTMDPLKCNVASASVTLSDDVLKAIGEIHRERPNPAP